MFHENIWDKYAKYFNLRDAVMVRQPEYGFQMILGLADFFTITLYPTQPSIICMMLIQDDTVVIFPTTVISLGSCDQLALVIPDLSGDEVRLSNRKVYCVDVQSSNHDIMSYKQIIYIFNFKQTLGLIYENKT